MSRKLIIFLVVFALLAGGIFYFNFFWEKGVPAEKEKVEAAATKTGLVGHWTMDRSNSTSTAIYDTSGWQNTGKPTGFWARQAPTSTLGVINEAINLDGKNGYITVANESNFDLVQYTLSVWVKADSLAPTNSWWTIVAKGDNGPFHIQTQSTASCGAGGELGIGWNNGSWQDICSGIRPEPGQWYHVAATSDGTTVRLYVDGIEKGNDSLGTPHQNNYSLSIGTNLETGARYWTGSIDDLRIYNRALSAQEITDLFNATKVNVVSSEGSYPLLGYWTMDASDTRGTTVYDRSKKDHHGTFSNGNSPTSTPGVIKQGIYFNGTNDNIAVGTFNPSNPHNITMSLWVKSISVPSGNSYLLVKGNDATANSYGLAVSPCAGGKLTGWMMVFRGGLTGAGLCAVKYGEWTFLTGVVSGNTISMYINGVWVDDTGFTGTLATSALSVWIGSQNRGGYYYRLKGWLDDIRFYDRALTAGEIMNLYEGSKRNYVSSPDKNNLVGHWAMDRTDISGTRIYDKSGNKNNGTLTGTAEDKGKIKEARHFNGTTDWINIPNSSSLTFSKAVTLSAWIKPNYFNSSTTDYAVIVGKRLSEADYEYQLYTYLTGSLCFAFHGRAWDQRFNTTNNLVAGKWQHVVGTYDGSRVELYKDGVNFWGTDDVTGLHTSTGNVGIGRRPDGGTASYYNGTIDDVRIYNRTLSDEEVINLYNSTKVNYK
ncbi:MAG: LamG domain-containing protein [Patescibacteria group bacterium]